LVTRPDPRDREVELAAREPLLDQLADLVLEREGHLGPAHGDLAEAVVDRPDLRGEALPGALELGRTEAGHAADHAGPPGGGVRTPEGSGAGAAASTRARAQRRDWQGVRELSKATECPWDSPRRCGQLAPAQVRDAKNRTPPERAAALVGERGTAARQPGLPWDPVALHLPE